MKKFILVVTLSLGTLGLSEDSSHTPATSSTAVSTPVRSTVQTPDKSAKLIEYINACMVKRPGSEDEIKKLFQ